MQATQEQQVAAPTGQEQSMLEMEHSIGYNGSYPNTVHVHPTQKDTLIYNIGGLLVIEDLHDKHK